MDPFDERGEGIDDLDDDVWQEDHSLRNAVIGVAVAVVLVGALLVGIILWTGGDDVATTADTTTSSTSTTVDETVSTTIGVLTPATEPTTTVPVTLPVLRVLESTLDFGTATTSLDLHIRNDGGQPLEYRVTTSHQAILVSPSAGYLGPGEGEVVRVTISRSGLAEGTVAERVTVDAGQAGLATVAVAAVTATPPTVVSAETAEPAVFATCPGGEAAGPTTTAVAAVVRDNSGVASAELRWNGPEAGTAPMALTVGQGNDMRATATIGPFNEPVDITWEVVAVDVHGNRSAAFAGPLVVVPCDVGD